jgi:hypothetical protein
VHSTFARCSSRSHGPLDWSLGQRWDQNPTRGTIWPWTFSARAVRNSDLRPGCAACLVNARKLSDALSMAAWLTAAGTLEVLLFSTTALNFCCWEARRQGSSGDTKRDVGMAPRGMSGAVVTPCIQRTEAGLRINPVCLVVSGVLKCSTGLSSPCSGRRK